MDSSPGVILMKKGKRGAAAFVLQDCLNSNPGRCLEDILDSVLNPAKAIDDWETIDWCKWLMAGGNTPDEFSSTVRRYDNATTCGLVWTANFVAYRCRTCGISPCMSLCAECFQRGDHDGHDFNMFRSQAGGACDCGDTSVMKETGFCDRHGPKAQVNKMAVPNELMCVTKRIMPRIILRLIQHLRESSKSTVPDAHIVAIQDADSFLTMLHDLSGLGAAMRRIMTSALTNPTIYKQRTDGSLLVNGSEFAKYMEESQRIYEEAVKSLPNPAPMPEYKDIAALQEVLVHRTFLEELVFWTVKFEFPQKVVCLLLNMLPDPDYKEALTQAFVLHYSRISMMLEKSSDPDTLSNRVVHVSVQLFSNEALALRMVEKLSLLHVMVISLKYMMLKILIPNILHDADKNFHYVVDCGRQVMKEHCYWPLVSDLNNVLSHRPVAVQFMSDDNLLEMWFAFLSMFQGMNVNQRELSQHVEFEPNTYYAAFSAELEASAYPMWALLNHLKDSSSVDLTHRVLTAALNALQDWFDAINMTQPNIVENYQVSFHLPLHRYLAVFMCQAVNMQGRALTDVLPPTNMLQLIMIHPLRVQVAFYEILNGLWVRNGLQIKGQAMTYIQCNFCNSLVDADLYLLQVCATMLPSQLFILTVLQRFHIMDWLSFSGHSSRSTLPDGDSDTPMLESCLTFLASLISLRTNLGANQSRLSQLEMVTLLCMGDKTHSQLMELMPERCGTVQSRDFESALAEVAEYKAPNLEASGNMQQGMYVPKGHVWEEMYDPIHVLLRAVHRREFQNSMDRFNEYVSQSNRLRTGAWPPYREPVPCHEAYSDPRKILKSKVFHALVWLVLYKAITQHNVSEHVISLIIYLLEMSLAVTDPTDQPSQVCTVKQSSERNVNDGDLENFYESDWLSDNLRTVISTITLPSEPVVLDPDNKGDEVWEEVVEASLFYGEEVDDPLALGGELPLGLPSGFNSPAIVPLINESEEELALPLSNQPLAVLAGNEVVSFVPTTSQNTGGGSTGRNQTMALSSSPRTSPSTSSGGGANTWNSTISRSEAYLAHFQRKMFNKKKHNSQVQVELPSPDAVVEANESIISLLLKLHSHLVGIPDSFNPDGPAPDPKCRIGDGPYFVGNVLHRIMALDALTRENVISTREKLWPRHPEEGEEERREREERERTERRRRAKERQQKLMEEFASRQKQFMAQAMETDEEGMEWDGSDNGGTSAGGVGAASRGVTRRKEYDCVICNQTSPSTEEEPMGLAVLIQATSVLGHRRRSAEPHVLPTSDEERFRFRRHDTLASAFDRKMEELDRQFNQLSWLVSVNLGWEGGVHVQTCGHHLHLDCLKSYLLSLRNQQRLAAERGEYACPLCRQLANSVLPLPPQLGETAAMVRSRPASLSSIIPELTNFLKENYSSTSQPGSNMREAMSKSMEDMTNSTYLKYKHKFGTRLSQTVYLFVSSIARTNLEIELVQRGGSFHTPPGYEPNPLIPKRSCIVPLLHVLAAHARMLANWPTWETWQQLASLEPDVPLPSAVIPVQFQVPLLLRDPTALLTQFILLLPLHLDQTYFTCVIKLLYNLLYFQVLVQTSCQMTETERSFWRNEPSTSNTGASTSEAKIATLEEAMSLTIRALDPTQLYIEDENLATPPVPNPPSDCADKFNLENQIQTLCLPFLRVAALLRHHMYDEPLPEVDSPSSEFVRLVYYLELVTEGMSWEKFNAAVALSWPSKTHVLDWMRQLGEFINRSQVAARVLLTEQHITWHQPSLLSLPLLYDRIFQYYHRRQCSQCQSVPRETSICLLCGALVCLKESCCKLLSTCEAVQHSIDCGAGTAMYLVVTSSYVIVIRGKRACLWGSVYLDSFGEEDRELKRGKPLYLSPGRYQLLQQQWLAHRFDHTNKKWVWHRDAL
ncbi:E3 ubiquitin-protein ligase Ubr3 isoform X2 [Cimex lectularius]|uniref:E3 ubiquitin-protein ligase n=1 Tax=Cimex lectularius TaxID=79782 RepID=A0A8I6RBC4_CIMLE|nr:E3 ubiquitin-protein ligase Ubr3 isoform X2 [Cimex lectularius]